MRWLLIFLILLLPVCSVLADDSGAGTDVLLSTRRGSSLESETEVVEDIKPVRPRKIGALIQRCAESPQDAPLDVIVVSLRAMGSEKAVSWADGFLAAADEEETKVLVRALGMLGEAKAIPIVAPLLGNEDFYIWWCAFEAISALVAAQPVEGLEEASNAAFETQDPVSRSRLIGIVGGSGLPAGEDLILSFRSEEHTSELQSR